MKITFTSGSPNNFDEFQFFNIQISSNDNSAINLETGQPTGGNGVDAFGQGIYGFAGISGKKLPDTQEVMAVFTSVALI